MNSVNSLFERPPTQQSARSARSDRPDRPDSRANNQHSSEQLNSNSQTQPDSQTQAAPSFPSYDDDGDSDEEGEITTNKSRVTSSGPRVSSRQGSARGQYPNNKVIELHDYLVKYSELLRSIKLSYLVIGTAGCMHCEL